MKKRFKIITNFYISQWESSKGIQKPNKDLRLGDSLMPFLYLIVVKGVVEIKKKSLKKC